MLATHSPAFVSPKSIQYISRVYNQNQQSHITRLSASDLPNKKLLFNIVNSFNNEKIFFADKVILVEGISDRIVFEAIIEKLKLRSPGKIIEIISIGGKSFFEPYGKILTACKIDYALIADLDYIKQIGTDELKFLFRQNNSDIKKNVIDEPASIDGETLVTAIEHAVTNQNWDSALHIWEYIKSKRRQLAPNLSEEQEKTLLQFITAEREFNRYILKKGALEAYLPAGYKGKDLEKIITFVGNENFWQEIDKNAQNELLEICNGIIS